MPKTIGLKFKRIIMKTIFLMLALLATGFAQVSFAQDSKSTPEKQELLSLYFNVKDALVSGNANLAASKSAEFAEAVKTLDSRSIPENSRNGLLTSADEIAKTKDLKKQREYFATFSEQMFILAKSTNLSSEPIYKAYCPMKKAAWLSADPAIKNPYYGSAMLTCGKVAETIK